MGVRPFVRYNELIYTNPQREEMSLRKYLPLLFSAGLLCCFLHFRLFHSLTLENLLEHHRLLMHWKDEHYVLAVALYMFFYSAAVSACIPVALFFSLAGGLLFGPFPGVLYVLFSATLGSILLYFTVNLAFADWFCRRSEKWLRA